jgi:23S rRNA pseudouridine1911/1915/1917 synthase
MTNADRSPAPGAYRFTVAEKFSGLRLDQFISEASSDFSRGQAKRIIDVGGVHLSGRRTRRCSQVVAEGDRVEVFVDHQGGTSETLKEESILYRDEELIVINKPAGMPTQPTPARYQGTLYAELQKLLDNPRRKWDRPSIGMVQRLDRDTSGVIVFSIHKRAHKKMTEAFRGRDVEKLYWALASGTPDEESGVIRSLLAKRRSTNLIVSVKKGGKPAETHYQLLQRLNGASLMEVRLVTGRSHQIRAHFSEAGMPLLGDTSYGGPSSLDGMQLTRQMLHARELHFLHPVSGKEMQFTAPLPEDFISVQEHLTIP